MQKDKAPDKIRAFKDLGFDFNPHRTAGRECFGECTFCGGKNKLYINQDTGQWDCKSCGEKGNVYSYMKLWYDAFLEDQDNTDFDKVWEGLSESRKLPVEVLKDAGLVYDGDLFFIPIRNLQSSVVNLRYYKLATNPQPNAKKQRIFGLTGVEAAIFGLETMTEGRRKREPVYLCEGEWDAIALRWLLEQEGLPGIVLGIPGSTTFKAGWEEYFNDRHVIMCYDHDTPGEQGLERVYRHIKKVAKRVQAIYWPEAYPDEYDIRDHVTSDRTMDDLLEMVRDYVSPEEREKQKAEEDNRIPISSKARPKWSEVIKVYRRHFHMTQDLEDALKVIFATILSTEAPMSPLWIHIIGPPGSGKTLLLISTVNAVRTYHLSKIKPKDLISGFIAKNGEDPSLIPRLDKKCLVVKDFTTTTSMPAMVKDELYGTLRDAFDGDTAQEYANNVKRRYHSHFNMLTGVTPAIYGERSATLGERFLYMHVIKGNDNNNDEVLSTVFDNVVEAKEARIPEDLLDITARYLDVTITREDLPTVPDNYKKRVIAAAEITAALRANVDRNVFHRKSDGRALKWRPQAEVATRLTEQLAKLLIYLGLIDLKSEVTDEEFCIVQRVAMDTCVGFNMDAIASLVENPRQDLKQLAESANIASTTLDDQLDDLIELGAVVSEKEERTGSPGRPRIFYSASKKITELWIKAGLKKQEEHIHSLMADKKRFKVRMIRRKRR